MANKVMVEVGSEFEHLPENCIANVVSFTTPQDAFILSLVSSSFRSAAESDVAWDRFVPSDYDAIISQSSTPLTYSSKKDLYRQLCQNPLLIDAGKMSFALDKLTGKKCYMLSARNLFIVWADVPSYWRWTSVRASRFSEVAVLVRVCWLEIRGWIKSDMLSPNTLYGAYLVFQKNGYNVYGFENQPVEASVGVAGKGDGRRRTVYLEAPRRRRPRQRRSNSRVGTEYPKERGDGWLEVQLGDFFNGNGDDTKVEMCVCQGDCGVWKSGLVVQGIEIRPKCKN